MDDKKSALEALEISDEIIFTHTYDAPYTFLDIIVQETVSGN